jgi:hypothetical protein
LHRETRLEALQLWSTGRAPTFSDSADGRKTMAHGDFFEVRISRTLGPISLGISLEILSIVDE